MQKNEMRAALPGISVQRKDGTSATTFSPDANCTRAQVVTFLYRFINAG